MKYFLVVFIFLNINDISAYLFDDPLYGEVKTTVKHDFLKEYRKQKKINLKDASQFVEKGEKKSSSSRWFGPGCAISNTGSGNDEVYESTDNNCATRPTLDAAIQTLCPSESLETYSGLFNGDNVEFSKFEILSGWNYKFTGKSKNTFYPFWRVYGDLQVKIVAKPCNYEANSVYTTRITITGEIQRNDKNIQVELKKPKNVAQFFISKFDSTSEGKIDMMGLLNYIQSGTAGSSFATQGSYFKADVLDNMHWDQFTGTGVVKLDGSFSFIISSKNELFPSTQESAKMHIIVEGTGQSASSYAFVSSFNNGNIMQTFKQFTTLNRNAAEAYFEFGRVNSYQNWCFILSSNDFVFKTEIEVMRSYQSLFGGCFDIDSEFQYEMTHGSTFRVKEQGSGGTISCGDDSYLTMRTSTRARYISGHVEAFGIRFSYDRFVEVQPSAAFECVTSRFAVDLPDWILNIPDGAVSVTLNDIYQKTSYTSLSLEIIINEGSSVQNPLPTDLVPSFAIKKIQLQFGKYFNKAGQFSCYLDAILGESNNVMAAMRLSASGWELNLKVQSMSLSNLFQQFGPYVRYLEYGWSIVGLTTVENLNILIDLSRRKLFRVTGVVTIKELSAVEVEAVFQVDNGLAVGLKCGGFNFEKTFEVIYQDVLNIGNPPKHTVPWLTSINSMVMISGMTKKDDALFQHPDLATFDDMTAGIGFRFEWNRPDTLKEDCINDRFCTFLSEKFTEGGSFVLSGGYQNKEFEIEGEMNTDITINDDLLLTQAKIVLKLDHSKGNMEITFGVGAQLKYYTEPETVTLRTPLIFEGYVEVSTQGAFKLLFTMLGKVDNPFGLPYVSIADAQIGIERPEPKMKFIYIRCVINLVVGNIEGVEKQEDGTTFIPDDAISIKGVIGINPKAWFLSYISVRSPHPLTLGRLEDLFGFKILPENVRDYGFQDNLLLEYSPTKIEDLPNGESINAGFRFKGKFKFLAWSGDADINIDLNELVFKANVQMDPISWFWGAIEILDADGNGGPHVIMNISPEEFNGDISGSIKIFGFETTSTKLIFNEKGAMLKQRLFNIFYLEIELYYGLSPIKGRFLFGIQDFSLKDFLIDMINTIFDNMIGSNEQSKWRKQQLEYQRDEFWRRGSQLIDALNRKIDQAQEEVNDALGPLSWIPAVIITNLIVDGAQEVTKVAYETIRFLNDAYNWMVDFINRIGNKIRDIAVYLVAKNLELKINQATVEGSFDGTETAGMRTIIDIEYKLGPFFDGRLFVDEKYGTDNEDWREINEGYFYDWTGDDMIRESGYETVERKIQETEEELTEGEATFNYAFSELQRRS